jgi:hypothetical protein
MQKMIDNKDKLNEMKKRFLVNFSDKNKLLGKLLLNKKLSPKIINKVSFILKFKNDK